MAYETRHRRGRRRGMSGAALVIAVILILLAIWYFGGQKSITVDPGKLLLMLAPVAALWQ